MMLARTYRPAAGDLLERCDFWRRSPASAGGPAGHKEWSYFCVLADDLQLVTAFSLTDHLSPSAACRDRIEQARLTLLARSGVSGWTGAVDTCTPETVALEAGRIDARFGDHALTFTRGMYRLDIALRQPPLDAVLWLRPVARPALTRSIPLGGGTPMQWFVVPRLEVSGEVHLASHVHRLDGAPAYHDHNWGRFLWGGDFAWEWGIALGAAAPWSLIYYRITDRARHVTVSQGLLLWNDERHGRTFRDGDLAVGGHGRLRTAGCLRVPRVMQLAIAGSAGDLPKHLEISARNGSDAIDLAFDLETCAQVCIPDDEDGEGVTSISECPAQATVTGRIGGCAVDFSCHAVVEFNRGAA